MGEGSNLGSTQNEGWPIDNRYFLCCVEKESSNHILIHCSKARVLSELLFALFGVMWVLPLSANDTLLGWHKPFVGKSVERLRWQLHFVYFDRFGRKDTG